MIDSYISIPMKSNIWIKYFDICNELDIDPFINLENILNKFIILSEEYCDPALKVTVTGGEAPAFEDGNI